MVIFFLLLIITLIISLVFYKNTENFKLNIKNIIYIHIGKTGGTTLNKLLKLKEVHHRKPLYDINKKYIISIRHPIERFISAYNMSKSLIINNELGVSNTQALDRFKENGYYYTEEYDRIFKKFKSLNDLCEQIFTSNDAYNLVTSITPYQHLGKDMSWYLDNGEFIKKHHKNIIYVAKQETLKDDIYKLGKLLNIDINYNKKNDERVNHNKDDYLSPLAIKNLKEHFKNTEYKTLHTLYNYGFIDKKYLDYCYTYE